MPLTGTPEILNGIYRSNNLSQNYELAKWDEEH
jgi:hypothetical protein